MYFLVLTFLPLDLFVGSMSCLLKECCPENQGTRVILNGDFLWTCTSLVVQLVKNLSAMQETPVRFLGQEDPLEKEWATHSSFLGLPLWLSW